MTKKRLVLAPMPAVFGQLTTCEQTFHPGVWLADNEEVNWTFDASGNVVGYTIMVKPVVKFGPTEVKHADTAPR